ncbi:glycosyl transferase group 1/2 family protein [Nitrospira sp. KM1]|uniref:glycosyltransferase n=1 Tax=Nitrospira sp. KM1 TaxID=1936990 RepID=UPI0013A74225|nr:glycosyltransferase [Nitrospira sp. KM1]BCA54460.1 glycosyl transferase group 1/2 family protein [Nitrospira sp. KM1]
MRILQVNTADEAGGAEAVVWQLMQGYRRAGHASWMAVGRKISQDSHVVPLFHDQYRSAWSRFCLSLSGGIERLTVSGGGGRRLHRSIGLGLGQPFRMWEYWRGKEDFDFPGTDDALNVVPGGPDLIHCHNLHGAWLRSGGYFDLSVLSDWSKRRPVVLTLHDAWMLSGHCAHSFECDRWQTGCGDCPDLRIYPAVRHDATAFNWTRKRAIYAKSRVYVATPSRWLMQKVQDSILSPAVIDSKVIPNGVDRSIFCPSVDKAAVRDDLGIPRRIQVLLFVAHGIRNNMWKDYGMLRNVMERVAAQTKGRELWFLALGEEAEAERIGNVTIRFVPYIRDKRKLAQYYQAADAYVHAAKADTFPHSVLEALACGLPVIATAVGGIPEQVEYGETGFLVPRGDAEGMAAHILRLLADDDLRTHCIDRAVETASRRFDVSLQISSYLDWFESIIRAWKPEGDGHRPPVPRGEPSGEADFATARAAEVAGRR